MIQEKAREKITMSERDALQGDRESEIWIRMSETAYIILLLLSAQ